VRSEEHGLEGQRNVHAAGEHAPPKARQAQLHRLAAGATSTLLPTLIIYFALQRQFVAGLTLGGTKG